ncbi:MAG TPA: SGNH/GDSL hydrolase family protein [Sphingomonas sp.]|nr:SGNH/GDSL hydrolase family protein [Sphingomonas sp.]
MTIRAFSFAFAAFLALTPIASPAPAQTASADPIRVGVLDDACAALDPMPAIVADYMKRYAAAKAGDQPPPPVTAAGMKIYSDWQDNLKAEDFPGLCRYRAANAALPTATDHRVILFGDSITELWQDIDPGLFTGDWLDRGISGQTTEQMLIRFRADVIALKPAVVQIMAGTNDIAGNTGPTTLSEIEDNISSMVDLAKAHHIRVVLASVPPAASFGWRPGIDPRKSIAALNVWLRAYAVREKLNYVDYHDALKTDGGAFRPELTKDGVHPNAAGYKVMRSLLEKAIPRAGHSGRRRFPVGK